MNIKDITSQIHSIVDIDKPIFSPSPNALIFEDYSPFAIHEKKLFFSILPQQLKEMLI